jgi:hypothetical protein
MKNSRPKYVYYGLESSAQILASILLGSFLLTELSPSWQAANYSAIQEILSYFREPEGSSPCSQEPSTGPYHPILYL